MKIDPATTLSQPEPVDGRPRFRKNIYLAALVTLAVGLIISVASFWFVHGNVYNEARLKFERQSGDAHHSIEARIKSYTDIVYGLRALLYSSPTTTREQFHRYIEGLDLPRRFPGVINLNYAENVLASEKQAFERRVQNDRSLDPNGYPSFKIHPPGERPYYHVINYLEPMVGVESSFGRDIIAQPAIRDIFERQIFASDDLSSSGRPPLIAGPPSFWSMAMRLPIYRQGLPRNTLEERKAALMGTLGTGFRVHELLQNVLDKETLDTLRFQVFEAGPVTAPTPDDRRLLFDSIAPNAAPGSNMPEISPETNFKTMLPLTVAGRLWQIQYSAHYSAMISRTAASLPWLVFFGGALISLLLFGMAYSLASSRSRAVAIASEMTYDLQKSEGELRVYADRLKAVSRRLFEVQESERRLLATELHDRVGANLSALGMNLSIIAANTSSDEGNALVSRIHDSTALIEQTADAMRNVMSELRPQAIDEYGLLGPLRGLASTFSMRTGAECTVAGSSDFRLPKPVELAMFRIVQEALNNIAKHARANRVSIELSKQDSRATLSIVDDGTGFDFARVDGARPQGHWGLLIMRERAEAAGARFSLQSSPGRGTRVTVTYPLEEHV